MDKEDCESVVALYNHTNLFISQSVIHNAVKNYNRLYSVTINIDSQKHTLLICRKGSQLLHILHYQVLGLIQKLKPMLVI